MNQQLKLRYTFLIALLLITECWTASLRCDLTPAGIVAERTRKDVGRYSIEISGNPETYVPGEQYTVFLRSRDNSDEELRFKEFLLVVEQEDSERTIGESTPGAGILQVFGDSLTKSSTRCPNSVEQTNSVPKSEIQVLWLAPQTGSGCVAFKATVVESPEIWFSEDASLTKILCEESPDSQDLQPNILMRCCACDEAKYESEHIRTIIKARGISYPNFTGKTFAVFRVDNRHHLMSLVSMIDPSPDWIVGVSSLELCLRNCSWVESRTLNLYPWDAGTDDGVTYLSPNVASSPRQRIRKITAINPNDTNSPFYDASGVPIKPLARLYLSRQRLYEKACDPSMDLPEDDGENCETEEWSDWSPCSATCGRGVKYKQRKYKNEDSKYVCNKRLTERASCEAVQKYCPNQPAKNYHDPLCQLSEWSEWSSCSVTCGKGIMTRDRKYKNRMAAKSCAAGKENSPKLQENIECFMDMDGCKQGSYEIPKNCTNKMWSEWSPCSVTCGTGIKERFLMTVDDNQKLLWSYHKDSNYEDGDDIEEEDFTDNPCGYQNIKERVECYQRPCEKETSFESSLACTLPKDVGACKSKVDRWYFNNISGKCEHFTYSGCEGNYNNFKSLEGCQRICGEYGKELAANRTAHKRQLDVKVSGVLSYNVQNDETHQNCATSTETSFLSRLYSASQINEALLQKESEKVDCKVSAWSAWSPCNVLENCGKGYKTKHRFIKVLPMNGGKPCPNELTRHKKCKIRCPQEDKSHKNRTTKRDCLMSAWSAWSPCSKTCGVGAIQHRTRSVLIHPKGGGKKCPYRVEKRTCLFIFCDTENNV